MPYTIRKVRNQECYCVKNTETGRIHAKCTTRQKAERQVRLLESIESGHIVSLFVESHARNNIVQGYSLIYNSSVYVPQYFNYQVLVIYIVLSHIS